MSHRFTWVVRGAVLLLVMSFASAALGQLSSLTISNTLSPSGNTLLRISGGFNPCLIHDGSTVTIVSNAITVLSSFHSGPCFGTPPPGYINLTLDAGHVPQGTYNVQWFMVIPPADSFLAATAAIPVVIPIPTMGSLTLAACALALALIGLAALRRRRPL